MRVLFDVQHPAQVHLFKHAVRTLQRGGHETLVTAREKELTVPLLEAYDIDHRVLSRRGEGLAGLALEAAVREFRLLSVAQAFGPDVVVSRLSPSTVHVSRLLGCRNVVFEDTNVATDLVGRGYYAVTLPFVDTLCVPPGLGLPAPEGRTRTVAFQELAYLHPDRFNPDRRRLEASGVPVTGSYSVVRLSGWDAYHDRGHAGLSPATATDLVSTLSERGPVYVSTEGDPPPVFEGRELPVSPHLVHDLLHYADLYVGDSGTMSSEAAMLGTPAVRVNTVPSSEDPHTFVELERTYDLLYSFSDEAAAVERAVALARDPDAKAEWLRKRERLAAEQGDVTDRMVRAILDVPAADPTPDAEVSPA
jgi:hypothetical protein